MNLTNYKSIICIDFDILIDNQLKTEQIAKAPIKNEARIFLKELSKDFLIMLYSKLNHELVSQWLTNNSIKDLIYIISNNIPKSVTTANIHLLNYHKNYKKMLEAINKYGKRHNL